MKNKLFGLYLIILALALLFKDRLPFLNIPLWLLIIGLLIAMDFLNNLIQLKFKSSLIELAILLILVNSQYHWLDINTWLLLMSFMLFYLGLELLFKPKSNHFNISKYGRPWTSQTRYIDNPHFIKDSIEVDFGNMTIYFDNADIVDNKAVFDIDVSFSSLTLYIPSNWEVHSHIDNNFSTVTIENSQEVKDKVFDLTGDVSFSLLTIKYL